MPPHADNGPMDDHQIHVPTSFQDLFRTRPGARMHEPWHHVLSRYEGVPASDVVAKMASGLNHPAVGLAPEEQDWVCTRLIELMENF